MLGAPWCARCARSRSVKIHPWARAACRCLPLPQKPTKAISQRKSRGRGISFSSACRPCSLGFNRLESKDSRRIRHDRFCSRAPHHSPSDRINLERDPSNFLGDSVDWYTTANYFSRAYIMQFTPVF